MTQERIGGGDYVVGLDKTAVKPALAEAEHEIKGSADRAEKDYAEAGKHAGSLFSDAVAGGLKVGLRVGSAALAFATKGLVELEDVTADYRREVGGTEEDAKKAGAAINAMSGRNIQPMKEIGSALAAVHTEMGLAGEEGEKLTERFLRFGRATNQDAKAAIVAFDNVLDAWGLTAKDSDVLMDKLIADHQKYGGSIEENQRALAAMAPQLKALNLGLDEGRGLLNLFASSGLDASTAQRALNTAITKLPPGTSLNDFIKHLATVTDDGQRADEAMKVFGTRAGAGLANAIRPGVGSLLDFTTKQNEFAGATDRAADAMDSSFGARAQLLLKQWGSAMNAAFRDAGPLITGLGSLATVGASFGVNDLIKGLAPKLIAGFKAVGQKAGDALGDGIQAVWQGAQGTVIGNFVASRLEEVVGPDESIVGRMWKRVATRGAMIFGVAWGLAARAGTWIADAMTSVFNQLPFSGKVRAAVLAGAIQIGTLQGTAMAAAASLAFKVGLALGIAQATLEIKPAVDQAGRDLNKSIFGEGGGPFKGIGEWLRNADWPIGPKNAPDWAKIGSDAKTGATDVGTSVTDGLRTALADAASLGTKVTDDIAAGIASGKYVVSNGSLQLASSISAPIARAASRASTAVETANASIITSIETTRSILVADATTSANAIYDPLIKAAQLAALKVELADQRRLVSSGKLKGQELAQAKLRVLELEKQLAIEVADVGTYGSRKQRISAEKAQLQRITTSREYTKGTAEQKAALRQQETNLRLTIDSQERVARKGGGDIRDGYIGPIKRGSGAAKNAAQTLVGGARGPMKDFQSEAGRFGSRTGSSWSGALSRAILDGLGVFLGAVGRYKGALRASSPPAPGAVLYGIDRWGFATGEAYIKSVAEGIVSGYGAVRSVVAGMAALAGFGGAGGVLSVMGSTSTSRSVTFGGTVVHRLDLTPAAAEALHGAGYDERAVAGMLSADASGLFANLQQRIALTSG